MLILETQFLLLARIRTGRAIRNIYNGVMAGESWALILLAVLGCCVILAIGYFAYQAIQEADSDSEDLDLTAEEKSLMNRF